MASVKERRMNISWVLADSVIMDPLADVPKMKEIGSMWGSWKTWRGCSTDNVICHDMGKAQELIKRSFQSTCNFYIPNEAWVTLDRPDGVQLYEGKFLDEFQPEEIVAMHLAASQSDIILLLGFDLTEKTKNPDRLLEHRAHVYRTLVKHCIEGNPEVQWVLVDHPGDVMKFMSKIPNLVKDSMETALSLLDS
jgi:hypothetical protein